MDAKYKKVLTLSQLDLSRGSRTSLSSGGSGSKSSGSGKSNFSSKSKEDRYNEAYKNDFKSSPKKKSSSKEAGAKMKSASPPKKKSPTQFDNLKILLEKKGISMASHAVPKPPKVAELLEKIKNPLTGRLVSIEYYNKLVKSGQINETPVAKKESPKSFDNFYEEVLKEISDYKGTKGKYQKKPYQLQHTSVHFKLANKLLDAIKDAYKKNPSWDYMKQVIKNITDDWEEGRTDEYRNDVPQIALRPIITKYGYDDEGINDYINTPFSWSNALKK